MPLTGAQSARGREQLAFARLAIALDNTANGTRISLVKADTRTDPAVAMSVSQGFVADQKILAVVGPGTASEVDTVGPLFGRAEMTLISGSATATALTGGANPTFFRTVPRDNVQGPQEAQFVISRLHPRSVLIVDDRSGYSTDLATSMVPVFRARKIVVERVSAIPTATDFLPVTSRITPQLSVVMLVFRNPASAQRLGKQLAQQRRQATLVGPDSLYAPTVFTIPASYVSNWGPDITTLHGDSQIAARAAQLSPHYGPVGPPTFAATRVIDDAITQACRSGERPSRSKVLAGVRSTNERSSILGMPIRFDAGGDLVGATWFMFHINARGEYKMVTSG